MHGELPIVYKSDLFYLTFKTFHNLTLPSQPGLIFQSGRLPHRSPRDTQDTPTQLHYGTRYFTRAACSCVEALLLPLPMPIPCHPNHAHSSGPRFNPTSSMRPSPAPAHLNQNFLCTVWSTTSQNTCMLLTTHFTSTRLVSITREGIGPKVLVLLPSVIPTRFIWFFTYFYSYFSNFSI